MSYKGDIDFLVDAREGEAYSTIDGDKVQLEPVLLRLSNAKTQSEALSELGIQIDGHRVEIELPESGRAYFDPDGDRTKLENEVSRMVVRVTMTLEEDAPQPLDISVSVRPFVADNVNFYGSIKVSSLSGTKHFVPLTGRGTYALEGRLNDAHAGPCTGGACATFQTRAAVVLAVATAAGANSDQIDAIGEKLLQVCDRYHGRNDILTYTIECLKVPEMPSYFDYMTAKYNGDKGGDNDVQEAMPVMLASLIRQREHHPAYFQKLRQKMSDDELQHDSQKFKKPPIPCFCC